MPRALVTNTQKVRRLASGSLVRARDLAEAGVPRAHLARMVDRGQLEQVDRGLYHFPGSRVTQHHALVEVISRVPRALVCLLSALQVHGLTSEVPHQVWICIDTRARRPTISNPTIKIVRASGKARSCGVETRVFEKVAVRLTTPAKTVADCFRYRSHVGLDVALAALRDYLRKYPKGIDELMRAANVDRVQAVMRPYLEALV